jgi:hypothetical protein
MCRASGRVPFLSSILLLSSPPLPSSRIILRAAAASCARGVACVRSHATESPATFKERTGTVTWTAAAGCLREESMREVVCDMRPKDMSSLPATDRPTPPFEMRNTWLWPRRYTLDSRAVSRAFRKKQSRRHCDPRTSRRRERRSIGFDSDFKYIYYGFTDFSKIKCGNLKTKVESTYIISMIDIIQ